MIASSLREGDDVVDLLLAKGADVSSKSEPTISLHSCICSSTKVGLERPRANAEDPE